MEETDDATIVLLARYAGELEAQVAQLTAELAYAYHKQAVLEDTIAELRRRLPVLEAAAGYERKGIRI